MHLIKNDAGELGFRVLVGGGMGRTPVIGSVIREFLPWNQIMNFIEAIVRVYNRWGRRDNMYKARIKILVKAEGQRYFDEVETEFREILERDGGLHTIPQAELDRVKTQWVASEIYKLDSVFNQARELGVAWTLGLPPDHGAQLMARLRQVTAAQVQAVAQKYFGDDSLTVAVLRPQPLSGQAQRKPAAGARH